MNEQLAAAVAGALGWKVEWSRLRSVAGGSAATVCALEDGRYRAFVKFVALADQATLAREREGLVALAASEAVRVPEVLGHGRSGESAWLALEWLDFGDPDNVGFARLGTGLAALHRVTDARHGWPEDNFIGAGVQINTPEADWNRFFRDHRLAPQLDRLERRAAGFGGADRHRLLEVWQQRHGGHQPQASLLHGDLWRGNVGMLADGRPVVFDPAVHYGDRECDLAMADLFGGFDPAFFASYQAAWPLPPGWRERRRFYQLYHLLNHANLFGGHYIEICRKLIGDLIRPEMPGE